MSEFLDRAMMTHSAVKNRLIRAIKGEEMIDYNTMKRDDVCEVGKWIYGEGGRKHATSRIFQEFKTTHAEFHKCASHVLLLHRSGKVAEANAELQRGAFEQKSMEIGNCIVRMKKDPAFI